MRPAYMDSREWHERIERQNRGSRTGVGHDQLHRYVATAFVFLDRQSRGPWLDTPDLLETYQAFVNLQHYARRDEELVFRDVIKELQEEMFYRLRGLIPPEMSKGYFVEEPKRKALRLFMD